MTNQNPKTKSEEQTTSITSAGTPAQQISSIQTQQSEAPPPQTTVFFNSECPVCNAEICHYNRLKATETAKGKAVPITFTPIIENPNALKAYGLTKADIERRLYALDTNGKLLSGIDAFIQIWQEMPRYRWLASLAALPPIHFIGAKLYDHIAVPLLAWFNARRKQQKT